MGIATNLIEESPSYQSPATSPSPVSGQAALQHTDRETVHIADSTQGNSFAYQSPIGPLVHETRTEQQVIRDSIASWLPTWSSEDYSSQMPENAHQDTNEHILHDSSQTTENAHQDTNEYILDDISQITENAYQGSNVNISNDSYSTADNVYQDTNEHTSNADTNTSSLG